MWIHVAKTCQENPSNLDERFERFDWQSSGDFSASCLHLLGLLSQLVFQSLQCRSATIFLTPATRWRLRMRKVEGVTIFG
jgi:hypothetical protein